jgi:histidinol-phosphate aminotransferase
VTDIDLRHHGDRDAAPGLLDLAVNVRLPAPPDWLRDRLAAGLADLGRYPDPAAAVAAVARRHRRPAGEVLLTAGAAEAFVLLARGLRPARPVCLHPSFTEPEVALRAAGHPVERVPLPPPYRLDPALVPAAADLVVLGNPTNPTGVLHDPAAVAALARPGRVLVVDEAFADTVPGERGSLAARRDLPGLVVVRSLTKTWALAGLRVGYLLGPADLLARLRAAQPAWPVSSLALAAAEACCTAEALAAADAAAIQLGSWRTALLSGLAALTGPPAPAGLAGTAGLARPAVRVAAPSDTSFLLLQVAGGETVRQRLADAGIAVRRGDTFPGLTADHFRVAVRDPTISSRFLAALADACLEAR